MAGRKEVIPEVRTLSPVDTHDYWKELCSKEDLRRSDFKKKHGGGARGRGLSYSERAVSQSDIYNGYGSGEKRETTLHSPHRGRYIGFARVGRLFVVPYHKTAHYGADSLDKTFLSQSDRRSQLRSTMQRGLFSRLYDTFDVKTYATPPHKTAYPATSPRHSSPHSHRKIKQLEAQLQHQKHMRRLAKKELHRRTHA